MATHLEESKLLSPKIEASRQRLLDLRAKDEALRESYDLGTEAAPLHADPAISDEIEKLGREIQTAQDELDQMLDIQGLSDRQLENALTPRTSMVLNAVNATRAVEFAGEMVKVARGPAKLANLVRQHTAETNQLAEKISRVQAESRRVRKQLRDNIKNKTESTASLRESTKRLNQRLDELNAEKEALLESGRIDVGDDVLEVGQQIKKEFNLNDSEISALETIIEQAARNAPEGRAVFLEQKFGNIGAATEGGEILYQTSSKTPPNMPASQKKAYAFLSRSGINVGDEAAIEGANAARAQVGLKRAGQLLKRVGEKIAETTGGHIRVTAGVRLASDRASKLESKLNGTIVAKLDNVNSAEDAELVAITMAMTAKENGATIFHADGVGKDTVVTLSGDVINGNNRQSVADRIKELGLDPNLTTYHIGDNGEIHFLLRGAEQKDEIEKINKLGYENVKTEKGSIKTVEAPLIQGESVEATRQTAQRYLYGRAKELQERYAQNNRESELFNILGNLTENERLFDRIGGLFESDIERAIHSLRGLNIVGKGKKVKGEDWLRKIQKVVML